ncbi:MAG: helix-turn-helix domain-containing protein [Candidatus Polarisedimenticolia bacterium]
MPAPRKERERTLRREVLIEAAERVFGRKPFDEATMQEVAREAEIGMQGLYEQFPSKQELYERMLVHGAELFRGAVDEALAEVADPAGQLRAVAAAYFRVLRDRPVFLPIYLKERVQFEWGFQSRFAEQLSPIYSSERSRLRAIVRRLAESGAVRPAPVEFLVQFWLDSLQTSLYYHHRHARREPLEEAVERALSCFYAGVGTTERRPA